MMAENLSQLEPDTRQRNNHGYKKTILKNEDCFCGSLTNSVLN